MSQGLFPNNRRAQSSRWHRRLVKWVTVGFCLFVLPLVLLLLSLVHPAAAATPKHYTELTFPPLPEIQVPTYERFQLDNGLVVYLMEDHELPLVSGSALFRTGARLEPGQETGLARITGTVMRSGGSATDSGNDVDAINDFLERRAASVETGISLTSGGANFSALSEDVAPVFDIFARIIQRPALPEDKIQLAKTQLKGDIARRNDNPGGIAQREFSKLIYGATSPYARVPEYVTLDNISRADIETFYRQSVRPEQMMLGIVGDFDPAQMRQLIEARFGSWQPAPAPDLGSLPPVAQAKTGGIFFVSQPQLNQSNILLGHLGGQANSPDYPALSVMSDVLSGFGGRLFNEVRSRQGLAYSVYGVWSPRYDYPGIFVAGGQTRSEATVPFIRSIMSEIEKMRTAPITADELKYAKDMTLNSFIFNFQQPSQTLSRLMRYEYYDYPQDFIFQYQKAVEATTIEDVQRVAQKYLQPDKLVTLVVGNESEIQPPLSQLSRNGKVSAIDIAIPPPDAVSRQ